MYVVFGCGVCGRFIYPFCFDASGKSCRALRLVHNEKSNTTNDERLEPKVARYPWCRPCAPQPIGFIADPK